MSPKANTAYVVPLQSRRLPKSVGNKAYQLQYLIAHGYRVPQSYVCTWDAYLDYLQKDRSVLFKVKEELATLLDEHASYAVRSSANVEDSLDYSFAGQFQTCLNVVGLEQVVAAVMEVWQSAHSETTAAYLQRIDPEKTIQLKMAVLIQEMVDPVFSGVAFSKNPITAFDEVVVESVKGSGTILVQDGYNPQRWINKWGGWVEQPEIPEISKDLAEEVVNQTNRLSQILDRDLDLEWTYDGQNLYWVQIRDITTLRAPNIYSNKIARETTPGLVQPLVWSVTVPIPSKAWVNLITEVIGDNDLEPDSLMRAFHYRAYHNMGIFGRVFESLGLPRESLEMIMGVIPPGAGKPPIKPSLKTARLIPRFIRFFWDKWTFAKKLEENYPRLYEESRKHAIDPAPELDKRELLTVIDQLIPLTEEASYYTIVTIILMQLYNGLLTSRLKTFGVDFQNFDLTEGMTELTQYDPNVSFAALNRSFERLDEANKDRIRSGGYAALQQMIGVDDFKHEMAIFFEQFGHLSDSTGHFGDKPWRETPDMIMELVTSYEAPKEVPANMVQLDDLPLSGLNGWIFKFLYHRARQFRFLRERYSSLFSYYLMLFRAYYLSIGEKFVENQLLRLKDDILFLYDDEVRAFIQGERTGEDFSNLAGQREDAISQCEDAIVPDVIFGDAIPPIITSFSGRLSGTPTSRGYYKGPVRVVLGVGDFPMVQSGDVLVIPYSEVSWTPLFTKAGAVIAESGGILSHSSIIAREYSLPAVVSVTAATRQLQNGMVVTVDGYQGQITIHSD
jgi:phosphohistidine swiveling domain-containing protein